MKTSTLYLTDAGSATTMLHRLAEDLNPWLMAGHRLICTVRPETRSTAQNARLWAMLGDVSKQVDWYGKKLSPDDWKHVFTAGLRKLDVVPNLDGTGFVALGMHTSRMSVREMGDLIELMSAFGAYRRVKWSDPALAAYESEAAS